MNENQGGAFYAPDTRNWWQRLLARLFPAKLVDLPDDAEGFAPGYTRTDVHMHLDLRDRLRTLVAHLDTPLETGGDTQVRYLRYADAEKIADKLKQQIQGATTGQPAAQGAQAAQEKSTVIWAEPATNALVVTAPPKLMRQLMSVVDRLDIRRPRVLGEAIIVEVSGDKNTDLGVNWLLDGSRDNGGAP